MYDLFNELPHANRGVLSVPQYIYTHQGLLRELGRLTRYYQERYLLVPNQHILVKLLNGLNVSMKRDIQSYTDTAGDQAMNLSRVLRMTSSLNVGVVRPNGDFYGRNNPEVLIAEDSEFNIEDATINWRDLQPVKVLRHPYNDMSFALPQGNYLGSEGKGIIIISINVPMLALQYRMWVTEERHHDGVNESGTFESVQQFVRKYPIVNMIYSHMDIALFNRLKALYRGEPVSPYTKTHPFYQIDFSDRVNDVLSRFNQLIPQQKRLFDQYLLTLPSISKENMLEAMFLPKVVPTRQVRWAMILARMPLITFLMQLNAENDNPANAYYINQIRIALREIRQDRSLESIVPLDVMKEFQLSVDEQINPYL